MKNITLSLVAFFLSASLFGQVFNDGGVIFISNGGLLHAETNVHNTNSGTLTNNGTMTTTTDFENSISGVTAGTGQYNVYGDWTNSSTFTANTSTVTFMDAGASNVTSGGDAFYNVEVAKNTGMDINLLDDAEVTNSLSWTSDNNKINIGANDLSLGAAATATGYDDNDYVVTGSTGQMIKQGLGASFQYPVGFDAVTYNPVTVTEAGTADDIGVRVMENMLEDGLTGVPLADDMVDASWVVTEAVAGGNDLTVEPEWAGTDEITFDRTQSGVFRHDGTEWTLEGDPLAAATGADPYAHIRSGIASVGVFSLAGASFDIGVIVAVDLLLQGPYLGSGIMNDVVRTLPDFPLSEPYSALGFTHVGIDGGTETINPAILTTIGPDAIVDWVFLELRDATTFTNIIGTRSALLQADGDVVDVDGVSNVFFSGLVAGSYYVAVKHRNHLGVMTPGALPLSRTPVPHDFRTGSAYGSLGGTLVQKNLGGGLFGLFEGDLDQDGDVDAGDRSIAWNSRNTTGYLEADCSLNGVCDAAERSQTWNNRNLTTQIP